MEINKKLFIEAKKFIPGGVNSPVRAFKAVGGIPIFIKKSFKSKIFDLSGKSYIDFCLAFGCIILGHTYPEVIKKINNTLRNGTIFGAPVEVEIEISKEIISAIPSIEKIRFLNSGTEATMTAIRLARAYTNRKKIIKFDGCYHGHSDYLLVRAGSGISTFSIPFSKGVPEEFTKFTFSLPYNNSDEVEKIVKKHHRDIACIILEPVAGNMGVILPDFKFLKTLRELCDYYKIVLIFDEIITGFRICYGGFQNLAGIKPDLTCLGKIIGGGLPVGALGGKKEIMNLLAPEGEVYQAGTFSANPLSLNAGLITLKILKKLNYDILNQKTEYLCKQLSNIFEKSRVKTVINYIGSMFTIFFNKNGKVYDYNTALKSDRKVYAKFFHKLLEYGIYFPPSQFESCFLSFSHTDKDIEKTIFYIKKICNDIFWR